MCKLDFSFYRFSNYSTMATKMMSYILIFCVLLAILDNTSVEATRITRLSKYAKKQLHKKCCDHIKCFPPDICVRFSRYLRSGCKCQRVWYGDEDAICFNALYSTDNPWRSCTNEQLHRCCYHIIDKCFTPDTCVRFLRYLRTYMYATKYFPCWNMSNTLHTVCFMHGLSIYEIKRICHCAYFFIISYGSFHHLTNFLNR